MQKKWRNAQRLIIFGHARVETRNGRVMILWKIIICLLSPPWDKIGDYLLAFAAHILLSNFVVYIANVNLF